MKFFIYLTICIISINVKSQEISDFETAFNEINKYNKLKQEEICDSLNANAKNDHDKVYSLFYKAHIEMYADDYNKSYSTLLKADSIIDVNKFKKEKYTSLNMLNGIYKNLKLYSKFNENILKIDDLIELDKNEDYYKNIKGGNLVSKANYFMFIDNYQQSIKYFKDAIKFFETNKIYNSSYVKAYNDLGVLYGKNNHIDLSIQAFEKMNEINMKYVKNSIFEINYYINLGVCNKQKENYLLSKKFLEDGLKIAEKYKYEFYISSIKDQLFIIYQKLGEEEKVDQIIKDQYEKKNEVLNNKLEANKNIAKITSKKINKESTVFKKYNIIFILIFISFVITAIAIVYYQIKNRKKLTIKFEEILERYNSVELNDNSEIKSLNESNDYLEDVKKDLNDTIDFISKQKEQEILEFLKVFEKEKKYLDKNINISVMSSELRTNSKYTTYILKKYRKKSYTNYINSMRINFLVNQLIVNQQLSKFKLDYLAEISGFSSHSRFTNVFKKEVGITPSEFLKKLKSKEDKKPDND